MWFGCDGASDGALCIGLCMVCVCVCLWCVWDARLQPHPPSDGLGAGDAVPVIVHEHGVSDDGSDAELEHRGGPAGLPGCVLGHGVVSAVVGVYVATCIASMCVGKGWDVDRGAVGEV